MQAGRKVTFLINIIVLVMFGKSLKSQVCKPFYDFVKFTDSVEYLAFNPREVCFQP